MKILSAQIRRDGKFAVRVDFTHVIRNYVWTADKLAEIRARIAVDTTPEPRPGQYGQLDDPQFRSMASPY